nr:flagellar protein FliS [uncultured Dongia sp.]
MRPVTAARAYRSAHAGSGVLDIVVAVYDAVIVDLLRAHEARTAGQLDVEFKLLQNASRLALGLYASLDRRLQAPVVASLQGFYLTMSFQILAIPRGPDPARAAARLLLQLRAMRDAWRQVLGQLPAAAGAQRAPLAAEINDLNVLL